jgi:hypothetical protein
LGQKKAADVGVALGCCEGEAEADGRGVGPRVTVGPLVAVGAGAGWGVGACVGGGSR